MKKLIVLAGVSGTGKTHKRTNELGHLPFVDIADVYKQAPLLSWSEAFFALVDQVRALLEQHDTVVVEGYFLPGSATRNMLIEQMPGIRLEFVDMHAPLHICRERIASSKENVNKRLEILERTWPKAQALYRRKIDGYTA